MHRTVKYTVTCAAASAYKLTLMHTEEEGMHQESYGLRNPLYPQDIRLRINWRMEKGQQMRRNVFIGKVYYRSLLSGGSLSNGEGGEGPIVEKGNPGSGG